MSIAWLVLLPLLFLINSYFFGKIYSRYYKTLSNHYSMIAGWFSIILVIGVSCLPFYFINEIQNYYLYFLLSIQILLVIIYLFNYKNAIFYLGLDWKKIANFLLIFSIISFTYLFFLFFGNQKIENNNPTSSIVNQTSLFDFFIKQITNKFNINNSYLYKLSFSITNIFLLTVIINSFFKQDRNINVIQYFTIVLLSVILAIITFCNLHDINNSNQFLYLGLFFAIHFLMTKYKNINFNNNYLIYSLFGPYVTIFNSSNFVYLLLIHLLFLITNYTSKKNFGLDNSIKSSIFLLIPASISVIGQQLFVPILMIAIFFVLISFYYIMIRNNNYYKNIYRIENYLNSKIKYFIIFVFLILSIVISTLLIRNEFVLDPDIFLINFKASQNSVFNNILKYSYLSVYRIIILFSFIYFLLKFSNIEKKYSHLALISLIVVVIYNPIALSLLYYVNQIYQIDYYMFLLILFLVIYFCFYRSILTYKSQCFNNDQLFVNKNQKVNKIILFFKAKINYILFGTFSVVSSYLILVIYIFNLI